MKKLKALLFTTSLILFGTMSVAQPIPPEVCLKLADLTLSVAEARDAGAGPQEVVMALVTNGMDMDLAIMIAKFAYVSQKGETPENTAYAMYEMCMGEAL